MNRNDNDNEDEDVEYVEEYIEEYVTTVPGAFDHDAPYDIYERVLCRVPKKRKKKEN